MIDRQEPPFGFHGVQHGVEGRRARGSELEGQGAGHAEDVGVTLEGRDLPPRQDQEGVEVSLQGPQLGIDGCRVVFGQGNEIEAGGPGRLQRPEDGAGDPATGEAVAAAVAMAGMGVKIAPVPAGACPDGPVLEGGSRRGRACRIEPDPGAPAGLHALADVGDAEDQSPFPRGTPPRDVGGRRVVGRQGEGRPVPAAPAPETVWVADPEIDDGPVLTVVLEGHGQPLGVLRDGEGNFDIGLVVLVCDHPAERDLAWRGCGRRM